MTNTQSQRTKVFSTTTIRTSGLASGLMMSLILSAPLANAAKPVLADTKLLESIGAPILATHASTGVSYAKITPAMEQELSRAAHAAGKCGGYEALPEEAALSEIGLTNIFSGLVDRQRKDRLFERSLRFMTAVPYNSDIAAALNEVSEDNVRATVQFLSGYATRNHKVVQANDPIAGMKARIEAALKNSTTPYQIDLVSHRSTPQKSIRVRIPGSVRPNEIIVLGGHVDSINQDWWGGSKNAPGADDNASGSADLLEALRVLATKGQPQRTIEFFWYAGEEAGLLGSAEIAEAYKSASADVVAVLQLDMTLFPGAGEFTLGSMTDFTSSWLRTYLEALNSTYIKARIVNDKCGYGCSDHASWHRQGYPTLMPFEATFKGMNHEIHTANDVISSTSNFRHATMFAKIALAIALDLGNSTARESAP